jgi:Asp-tRNA(Asn)/Glu-tRNA(Gln) amidotransferase A subunit family amidase
VGFKPSFNRIPSPGLVYFSRTADQIGLFTTDIAGMALAASVLCQAWRPEPLPENLPALGVPDGPYLEQTEPAALVAFEHQLAQLEAFGCSIKRLPTFADIEQLNQLHRHMVIAEFAQEHSEMYARHADLYRPRTAEIIEIGKKVGPKEIISGRANCSRLRAELEAQMIDAGIDLWVCPAAPGPAPEGIYSTGDPKMNLPWTHALMPAITLPVGWAENGLPLGLQLVAPFGADEYLLSWSQMLADRLGDVPAE